MIVVQSFCENSDRTAPSQQCQHCNGRPCEPCNELTEIEAQVEDLHERRRKARLRRNHVHSPLIHRFPPEIVTYIFVLAFPPRGKSPCCDRKKGPSPLVITKVCHTWRVLALSTPRLWCEISVDAGKPNFPLLDHQVAHSGIVPLSIHLFGFSFMSRAPQVKDAMSFVLKLLHRTGSFYISLPEALMKEFDRAFDLDYPTAAPLLEDLHVHCSNSLADEPVRLRLTIEPPRPRHVRLAGISCNEICLNWTNIATLYLDCHRVDDSLPEILAGKDLKHLLIENFRCGDVLEGQTLVVNPSIERLDLVGRHPTEFLLKMTTLPSLRTLTTLYMDAFCPTICDFLHRSTCPLEILTIDDYANRLVHDPDVRPIATFLRILENTNTLQQLSLRQPHDKFAEPFVRRLSSDTGFLPHLQTFSMRTTYVPSIELLVDVMAAGCDSSEIANGLNTMRPLHELFLEMCMSHDEVVAITRDYIMRLLQVREAGKTFYVTYYPDWSYMRPLDLVDDWTTHDFEQQ